MKLENKVIVVTGAGSGIGQELVLKLLSRNAKVAGVDLKAASLEETRTLAGARADAFASFVVDVSDRAAVEALPAQVIERFGAVDGIINNAGIIQPFVRFKDLDYCAMERVLNVNLWGTLFMTKAFLPHLLTRPVAHITNVSSMGGFLPVPGQTIYGAAKAAVKLFTEGLRSELLDTNVKVTVVFPGAIRTNIAANSNIGAMPSANAEQGSIKTLPASKAAELILNAIEEDAYRVLVGSDAKFMDAIYRFNPRRAAGFIYGQMKSLLPN